MSGEGTTGFIAAIRESFCNSFGEIVFGMSDGTVSIFGLVAGMVAGAQTGSVIVLAGATAAIAATVSMMAGVFMDIESERDETRVENEQRLEEIRRDPQGEVEKLIGDLQGAGLSTSSIGALRADFEKNPLTIKKFEDAVAAEEQPEFSKASVYAHAAWMGIADFIAAITPVLPFAILPFEQAKIACIAGTALLLFLLGLGRARIGRRPFFRTVLETMAIATAAGIAGVAFGLWLT